MTQNVKVDIHVAATLFHHKRFTDALQILEYLLRQNATDENALYLTALVYSTLGDVNQAITYYEKTLECNNRHYEAYNNLGVSLETRKQLDRAEKAYRSALAIKPDYVQASFHLGNILHKQGKMGPAEEQYLGTLKLKPSDLNTLNNLGKLYLDTDRVDDATVIFENALQLCPNDASLMVNLGRIYIQQKKYDAAITLLEKATRLAPNVAETFHNLGLAYLRSDRISESIQCYLKAVSMNPHNSDAFSNLGVAYQQDMDFLNAEKSLQRAVAIDPDNVNAQTNLGYFFVYTGNTERAIQVFELALEKNPTNPELHFHLAQVLLSIGKFSNGWDHYRYRGQLRNKSATIPFEPLPMPLENKRILLQFDQGIGDELFFLRFAPEIHRRGGELLYLASEKISPLLRSYSSLNILSSIDEPTTYDYRYAVSDLPYLVAMRDTDILPPPLPLTLEAKGDQSIMDELRKIGPPPYTTIAWRAGLFKENKLKKEIPLSVFGKMLRDVPGTLISIQRNPLPGERESLATFAGRNIGDYSLLNDNLLAMLDLLSHTHNFIGVSNTNVHLIASLGKSALILVPYPAEWRWMQSGKVSPWFPHFTIFRQDYVGSWQSASTELSLHFSGN